MRSPVRQQFPLLALAMILAVGQSQLVYAQDQPDVLSQSLIAVQQSEDRSLPDIATLMCQVEANQKAQEAIRKNYLFHAVETREELDGKGSVKKAMVSEFDVFWINGVPVTKLVKKDGKDLAADEKKKEDQRIDAEVAKAREKKRKAAEKGNETTPRGDDEISVARILELGEFSNPRRVKLDNRDTIVVDYSGNPKAKTRNRGEDVFRDLVGTVWIDERDSALRRMEGHFLKDFKIGGGLLVNIHKETSFRLDNRKINDEVWLWSRIEGKGSARFLLLKSLNGSLIWQMSDYRKFKTTSTILPGVSTVEEASPIQ